MRKLLLTLLLTKTRWNTEAILKNFELFFMETNIILGESNGKLPLRPCPGCSVSEPYQSPD